VLDCYWDTEASGISTDIKATPKTTAEMKQQATYTRWNFDALWSIEEGVSYPDLSLLVGYPLPTALTTADLTGNGTEADPYLLSNADELNVMRQALSAWYVLDADIDLSPTVVWNNGLGWEAAGTAATPFTGHFNGNGHTLDGLAVCRPQTDYQGLFGNTPNAVLDGLNLSACNVWRSIYTGSLVGHALSGSISDVSVRALRRIVLRRRHCRGTRFGNDAAIAGRRSRSSPYAMGGLYRRQSQQHRRAERPHRRLQQPWPGGEPEPCGRHCRQIAGAPC
jgi:hypothetical protein